MNLGSIRARALLRCARRETAREEGDADPSVLVVSKVRATRRRRFLPLPVAMPEGGGLAVVGVLE